MNGSWASPNGAWATPSSGQSGGKAMESRVESKEDGNELHGADEEKYYALVVDSGAIIKHTGFSTLHNSANKYVTTQGVIDEIRDSKARSHLDSLPFELEVREPTPEGLSKVIHFSKKTGDYASLSSVDVQILALQYDLEKEGCTSMDHIRTEPKRRLQGKIVSLNKDSEESAIADDRVTSTDTNITPSSPPATETGAEFFQGTASIPPEESNDDDKREDDSPTKNVDTTSDTVPVKKSWAALVNPNAGTKDPIATTTTTTKSTDVDVNTMAMSNTFGSMNLTGQSKKKVVEDLGGQFSDAEDDESLDVDDDSSEDDGEEYASIDDDFSDEECDVYILDPEEVEEAKNTDDINEQKTENTISETPDLNEELDMEFPSLSAASAVPYEGSDDEGDRDTIGHADKLKKAAEEDKKRREASLQPTSKSGKLYNSFRNYKDIVVSQGVNVKSKKEESSKKDEKKVSFNFTTEADVAAGTSENTTSRVIGGTGFSGQSDEVEDDGEGWVTSTKEIFSMKASGTLDPFGNQNRKGQSSKSKENLPPKSNRAACATTDFAMQNVILQMNLELLSVDGMKLRKLKSWVTRCAACYKVYTGSENDGKRLFCSRCGSASLQRIAASVDGKTGRLKLHLKKNYQTKTRGTKFALPKPGTQNRFMGDLLLTEDQLMYGAWNQRVRRTNSNKEKESIFGSDITTSVGCHTDLTKRSDIKVGFGRKNPNASKFGRERRGKKKKSTDKACGLRRY